MRGRPIQQTTLITLMNVESRIPKFHPIREVKRLTGEVFRQLDSHFEDLYAEKGRSSIPPERLLGAKVLMALYSVRSDRQFCERLRYDLLFQWFLDINPDEPEAIFDASSFSKNQERLLGHATADAFFAQVVELARAGRWLSNEHFSVDGTLIEAWASMKSFRPKDEPPQGPGGGNPWQDFHGEKRSNETHQSRTDPEARLLRKGPGKEAKLCFAGHAVMENRTGLCVLFEVTPSVGVTESQVALEQVRELQNREFTPTTVGADKGYHSKEFVQGCREAGVAPHVAEVTGRHVEGLDGRTKKKGYETSQRIRKRIEEIFGWMKTTGGLRKTRYRGVERTHACGQMVAATYNLLRLAKLGLQAVMESPPPQRVGA
jgi:Transposase and inactivated derivatives